MIIAPVEPCAIPTKSRSTHVDPADHPAPSEPIPLMQRLFDNIWLLLIMGIVVMFVVYTGWGMWEILTMPTSTLP